MVERALQPINPWYLQFKLSEADNSVMCPYLFTRDHHPYRFPNVIWTAELGLNQSKTLCSTLLSGTCVPVYSQMTVLDLTSTHGQIKRRASNYTETIVTSFSCSLNPDRNWNYISPTIIRVLTIADLDKKMWEAKPETGSNIWKKFEQQTKDYVSQVQNKLIEG